MVWNNHYHLPLEGSHFSKLKFCTYKPPNHHSALYELNYSRYLIEAEKPKIFVVLNWRFHFRVHPCYGVRMSFLFKGWPFHCDYMPHFIYLFVHPRTLWTASTFWLQRMLLLWIWVCKYFEYLVSVLLRYIPRSWIAASYGNFWFIFLKKILFIYF